MEEDLIGRVIGSYRVDARIGAGGMGEVYRAHDAKLDRPVALKLLSSARGIDAARALGAALFHTYYLGLLADTLRGAGRFNEAVAALDEADGLVAPTTSGSESRSCSGSGEKRCSRAGRRPGMPQRTSGGPSRSPAASRRRSSSGAPRLAWRVCDAGARLVCSPRSVAD